MVTTRFAPSPTGNLHLGNLRTALFNWLYARHHGGTFHVRVEDTDRARSDEKYVGQIFNALSWLGLDMDSKPIFQHQNLERHAEIANILLEKGAAYKCFATPEELERMRAEQTAQGKMPRYDRRWRDRDPSDYPTDIAPVIRLKVPLQGQTVVKDGVKGTVTINNAEIDDFILLRSDGNPTYMLSVVVDDHDLGVTDIIRGDDHFTNTFRQQHIYQSMGWSAPQFSHIPLIHDENGKKLSKRRGATSVNEYIEAGYLPEAFMNFLLRMGWGHRDKEIFTRDEAIELFDIEGLGKSPAKFDLTRLSNLSGSFLKKRPLSEVMENVAEKLNLQEDDPRYTRTRKILPEFITRSSTFNQIAQDVRVIFHPPQEFEDKARALIGKSSSTLLSVKERLETLVSFTREDVEQTLKDIAENMQLKQSDIVMPLRSALTGKLVSPPIADLCEALGQEEVLKRIESAVDAFSQNADQKLIKRDGHSLDIS